MNIRGFTAVLVLCACALAACQQASFVPQGGGLSDLPATNATLSSLRLPGLTLPDVTSICAGVKPAALPGKHVLMIGSGNLKGSAFTAAGSWFLFPYVKGTPGPTPGVTPTPGKIKIKEWLYYGTYTLHKKKESGCAFVIATQSGKPLPKTKDNAFAVGSVIFKKNANTALPTVTGFLMMSITGISATSGNGTITLTTSKGAPYDTATITLVGRVSTT